MSKHTPGPWVVIENGLEGYRVGTNKRDGHDTCTVQTVYKEANARLIAAAPEMLDALNALVATLPPVASMRAPFREGVYKAMVLAMKAAAKAEGRE